MLEVEAQPLKAQAKRVAAALQFLGQPLTQQQQQTLDAAVAESDDNLATNAIQKLFDSMALAMVHINPEQRVKVDRGPAAAQLHQSGWTLFLLKVHNEPGINPQLNATSPNAVPVVRRSTGSKSPKQDVKPQDIADRWLDLMTFDQKPLTKTLTGLTVEYRILQLYSRDAGKREAKLSFNVGQGSQDLGFRNELNVLFDCQPAVRVTLEVIDDDGQPTTGQFVFRDSNGRVYPARTRRLAPDFFFHDQIYRDSGETVLLPPGTFQVTYSRGPEYRILQRQITIPNAPTNQQTFRLKRWIKLADKGWFSGDHHVHAAGCSHYEAPTQGVDPAAMMRHIRGEDLNVGCVLTWGPCWYFQKDFFEGKTHALSTPNNLMRYDVEVSGFPSDHCGHLCLLRLSEDDYPGTKRVEDWPSWDLPILKWGKEQGGVVGFSHSGWGLQLPDYLPDGTRAFPNRRYGGSDPSWKGKAPAKLPDYAMPRFDGIGANEYVVDVVHGVCDFISAVDTPITWELNVWYHTLNCGYTCRISGETDFPCIYGERVGLGRAYVKLGEDQELSYDNWVFALRDGRSYCSDGLSHLYDFQVNGLGVGERGEAGRPSLLAVKNNQKLTIGVNAAALLAETPRDDIRNRRLDVKPYWHVERARVANTRRVPVELIVNGQSVARQEINADGSIQNLSFDYALERSGWVALRIFPSAHTNPIFVEVDGQPIRASKRSAKWCLEATETCWNSKKKGIRETERAAAIKAYDKAREAYSRILEESFDDEN
ncbi:MAG: hypothetical protein CMJ75_09285 [Planctomycetaceae bacterium]|nr:hypothetical protein [Planctomycetaceae bacterium]